MSSDDIVDLTVDLKDRLPDVVIKEWLPAEDRSIFFLFQEFNRYPPHPSHYILPTNFQLVLHQDPIQGFIYESLLRIPPPALPSVTEAYQGMIKKSKNPTLSVTLQPQYGNPITLPVWIFDYWVEIRRAADIRKQWKTALIWVQQQSTMSLASEHCQDLLLGLSSFSWSHWAAYSHDITSLLANSSTKSFLNSFHIDHMVGQTRDQYKGQNKPDIANHHVFATVDELSAIIQFYGAVHMKREGYLWDNLMVVENKIITGEVDSFGGIIHLPMHWASVVIDFQRLNILYGDSFGQQMPQREHLACERWIKHLINRSDRFSADSKITHELLPTGHQMDSNSCGLFALNSIAHHYLEDPLLPSDSTMLACR